MSLDNFVENLNPLKAKAFSLVDRVTQQATSVDDYLVDGIGNSLNSRLTIWLTHHPYIAWLINHPLIALVTGLIALILTVRLLLTIYNAIASTIDRMWLAILRSPVRLLKFLFGWQPKPKVESIGATVTNYEITQDSEQIQQILTRLDKIQQQQQQIIQDLAELKQQQLTISSPQLKKLSNKGTGLRPQS